MVRIWRFERTPKWLSPSLLLVAWRHLWMFTKTASFIRGVGETEVHYLRTKWLRFYSLGHSKFPVLWLDLDLNFYLVSNFRTRYIHYRLEIRFAVSQSGYFVTWSGVTTLVFLHFTLNNCLNWIKWTSLKISHLNISMKETIWCCVRCKKLRGPANEISHHPLNG